MNLHDSARAICYVAPSNIAVARRPSHGRGVAAAASIGDEPDGREDMTRSLGGDTPAVARERVRSGLRRARRQTDLKQTDVAKRLRWSLSKVQRVETGEVAVSETDIRALLALYGVTDADTVETMAADA